MMVYTKLERSFDSQELHSMLSWNMFHKQSKVEDTSKEMINKIERPPLPRGSTFYELAKGEMEIERQSLFNGKDTLPVPQNQSNHDSSGQSSLGMCHLVVPASSPVMGRRSGSRTGSRSPSRSRSPQPRSSKKRSSPSPNDHSTQS